MCLKYPIWYTSYKVNWHLQRPNYSVRHFRLLSQLAKTEIYLLNFGYFLLFCTLNKFHSKILLGDTTQQKSIPVGITCFFLKRCQILKVRLFRTHEANLFFIYRKLYVMLQSLKKLNKGSLASVSFLKWQTYRQNMYTWRTNHCLPK